MKILALDPGGTTGVAFWTNGTWSFDQLTLDQHHLELEQLLDAYWLAFADGLDLVICEDWDNRAKADAKLISLEYIGVVKPWARRRNAALVMQQAAKKEWATNRVLSVLGVADPTAGSPHARDACRHIVVHLINKEPMHPEVQKMFQALRKGLT